MPGADFVLVQLSDLHLRADPDGEPAAEALAAAVEHVLALPRRPDAVLLSGDLADDGSSAAYERVRELVAPLPTPVVAMVGNHDDRARLCAAFDLPCAGEPLVQFTRRLGPLRLVCGDTIEPGTDAGRYGPERLAWLRKELEADRSAPTIVALHHPPVDIGLPGLDELGLPPADRDALAALLAEHPQVQRVATGHVHRCVAAEIGGRSLLTCPSTYLQALLDLRHGIPLDLHGETPGYVLHAWVDGRLASHLQPLG
jgi:3',5'-cyclic-AMP phosphodiesterase